ncbi:MAG: hypothetical protein ACO1N8_07325 [Methylophilus sp.]
MVGSISNSAAQAMAEYNSTGKLTNIFMSVLNHFKAQIAIKVIVAGLL